MSREEKIWRAILNIGLLLGITVYVYMATRNVWYAAAAHMFILENRKK